MLIHLEWRGVISVEQHQSNVIVLQRSDCHDQLSY